jgi:hypothetical protein
METTMRQTWAFIFRGYHLTRRYIGWVIVFNFYALVTSATVALIGVAAGNYQMTLTLVVGALLWNYLSWLYQEIAMSIAYERWEGTLEYTFMAPGLTPSSLVRCQFVFAHQQRDNQPNRSGGFSVVHEFDSARCESVWCAGRCGS